MATTKCELCNHEVYSSEANHTYVGTLCKGCYNNFLEFDLNYRKKEVISGVFLYLLPIILLSIYIISIEMLNTDWSGVLFPYYILITIAAYRLVKNGFSNVGEPVKQSFLKGQMNSDNTVNITEESYNSYTISQMLSIVYNIVLFVIGLIFSAVLGPIVFIVKVIQYKHSKNIYIKKFDHNISPKDKRYSQDFFHGYKGIMFDKIMDDPEKGVFSVISNIKYKHVSYLIYQDKLYGILVCLEDKGSHYTDEICFIKLKKYSAEYDFIQEPEEEYKELYEYVDRTYVNR